MNNTNIVDISKMHKGQRYLFLKEYVSKDEKIQLYFRANFLEIINDTLIVNIYNEYYNQSFIYDCTLWSMPKIWIKKALTLEDIIGNKSKLPSEILREIDSYIT
jgi:hypothetical protein